MSKKARGRVQALVDDLTTLQINTIRQADLTGDGMSDPRHGLHDIADKYNAALNAHLAGDVRRIVGDQARKRSVITAKFVEAAHRPDTAVMLAITVKSERGAALNGVLVTAEFRPAPSLESVQADANGADAPRAQLKTSEPIPAMARMGPQNALQPIRPAKTDEHGAAFVLFNLPESAQPGCCLTLTLPGIKVDIEVPVTKVRGNLTTFHYLNRRANEAPDRGHWLVRRIELNSVRIVGILQALAGPDKEGCDANDCGRRALNGPDKPPPMALGPADLVRIRKIWELGCEQIVMQTIVQLDGDVVTRLSGGIEGEQHRIIHRVHADGVRVATESWQYLVETVTGLSKSFLGWFGR